MMTQSKPSPEQILQARADNPKMRERDFAQSLAISEADFVAAHCGAAEAAPIFARRVRVDIEILLERIGAVGEVMVLTRNESAVHEKIGPFEKTIWGKHAALALGKQIDLRIFPKHWVHGFAVEKRDGDGIRRSLQFFDAHGEAVHKIHLRTASNVEAYEQLVSDLLLDDQSPAIEINTAAPKGPKADVSLLDIDAFRERWGALTDVHQFVGLLRDFGVDRHQAVHLAGHDFAWRVDCSSVEAMMNHAVQEQIPIMCFVGSRGCIQIHSGPIREIKTMGPWLNVLDPTFHLHLRADHIADVWVVRKPTKDGHVTSLEAYDAQGEMIIQFFGERHEGEAELEDWRMIAENLPRLSQSTAA
ncbi:hemin-degrading factor [Ochrobactrum sp. CM-21-5]|nr:ChuX/HutX family heme-like substrate-binding protein [Ochrobactrum sp. CM-21-5]MBC2885379.1 hemin-degrading factor [Ochrobactrum sp. CM-21-5]